MKPTISTSLCGLAVVAALLPAALSAQAKIVDKTYRVQGHGLLQMEASDGAIRAESCGTCTAIQVHLDMRDADPERYELKESQQGSVVRFELRQRGGFHWGGWARGPEITVQLPADSDSKLSSGSGSLHLRGVHGQQEMHTGSGSIEAENVGGSLHVDTGSGSIHLHGIDAALIAHTGSGTIEGNGRLNLRRATTGSGGIHLTLAEGSTLDSSTLVETGSGSVELRVSPSTRAELRLSTGSGSLHCDLPLTVQGDVNKHALRGTLNGGGPTLRVSTGSGSVAIRSL